MGGAYNCRVGNIVNYTLRPIHFYRPKNPILSIKQLSLGKQSNLGNIKRRERDHFFVYHKAGDS